MHFITMAALLALQVFHALFLVLHDWIPLGTLNDVKAVRAANPGWKLFVATAVSSAPFAVGLAGSVIYFRSGYPEWLFWWLWISYGLLFAGELNAWWIPYFFGAPPERAERYRGMFGATHAFLPERNGIRPNTLHVILHVSTVALLIALLALTVQRG
jgi:hypothetical protein